MPAALDIDREAVRMLVLQYGVREAARQLGLPEGTVQAWSARGRWLADAPRSQPLPPTVIRPATDATISPAQAMANVMREDAQKGRAAALRVTRRALERADRYDDDELMVPEVAGVVHTYVKSAATAGGYGASDTVARLDLRVTSDRQAPQTVEAEWTECAEGQEFVE